MMNKSSYKTYDDLPLMLLVPDVAKVLGISRAGAYDLAHSRAFPSMKVGWEKYANQTADFGGISFGGVDSHPS